MKIEKLLWSTQFPQKAILEKLCRYRLDLSKEDLFTKMELDVQDSDYQWIKDAYTQYTVDKKPLEYIIWKVEFAWLSFAVTPKTLIPRPETEYMIQAVREELQDKKAAYILDVWTWCGVLGLSATYHHQDITKHTLLTELDTDTLAVAEGNARALFDDLNKISFLEANLLDHEDIYTFLHQKWVILVANLPYIPVELFEENTDIWVKKREPKMAFVWGKDGCDLYRIMFDQLLQNKEWVDKDLVMFLEMMTWQVDVLRKEYPMMDFQEVKTFHFNIRIVRVEIN